MQCDFQEITRATFYDPFEKVQFNFATMDIFRMEYVIQFPLMPWLLD